MIVLGLLAVLVACGSVFLVITQAGPAYTAFGYTVAPTGQEMFLAGALATFLLAVGLWMMSSGSVRSVRRRRAIRSARAYEKHKPQPAGDRLVAGGADDTH
ncbi:hypothetical protein [Nonomuraea sediminis]|uniref:hypothetical protein n=1 Tax=Nonomuraea sediminis TaxID=2835864 RepID=UPI001BDC1A5E|nr:hypothetical protein [Nonomuraea sediminis]